MKQEVINLTNKIAIYNFNTFFQEEVNELILEANLLLSSGMLSKEEKHTLLASMKDFSKIEKEYALNLSDSIFWDENFRRENDGFKLNEFQIIFLKKILDKKNYSMSLPTSFGKSFLIRMAIKSKQNQKTKSVIIVPTNALINEYKQEFKKNGVSISSNPKIKSDVYVLTQEKAYSLKYNKDDLIIFDEAYEMIDTTSDRNILLAYVLKKVLNAGCIVKLVSPNIKNPLAILPESLSSSFISYVSTFSLTSRNLKSFSDNELFKIINENKEEGVLIYCKKNQAFQYSYSNEIITHVNLEKEFPNIFKFLDEEYGDLLYVKLLKKGVIIHNGDTPKPIRIIQELLFKTGNAKIMFATSTISQGVNLSAKTLIILKELKNTAFNKFGFRNLIGRVGRFKVGDYKIRIGNVFYSENLKNIDKLINVNSKTLVEYEKNKTSSAKTFKVAKKDFIYNSNSEKKDLFNYYLKKDEDIEEFKMKIRKYKNIFSNFEKRDSTTSVRHFEELLDYLFNNNSKKYLEDLFKKTKPKEKWNYYLRAMISNNSFIVPTYTAYFEKKVNKYELRWMDLSKKQKELYMTKYISNFSNSIEKLKSLMSKLFTLYNIATGEEAIFDAEESDNPFDETSLSKFPNAEKEIENLIS